MILISMLVSFGVIFVAGMHWAIWDNFKEKSALMWSIGLSIIGIYNLIILIGTVAKA
jgi:hypothetical protein